MTSDQRDLRRKTFRQTLSANTALPVARGLRVWVEVPATTFVAAGGLTAADPVARALLARPAAADGIRLATSFSTPWPFGSERRVERRVCCDVIIASGDGKVRTCTGACQARVEKAEKETTRGRDSVTESKLSDPSVFHVTPARACR